MAINDLDFEPWWKKNYEEALEDMPGAMQNAWREVAEKAFKAGYDEGYDDAYYHLTVH